MSASGCSRGARVVMASLNLMTCIIERVVDILALGATAQSKPVKTARVEDGITFNGLSGRITRCQRSGDWHAR